MMMAADAYAAGTVFVPFQVWETELFSGAYDGTVIPFERVKYGVLNVTNDPHGVRAAVQASAPLRPPTSFDPKKNTCTTPGLITADHARTTIIIWRSIW